MSGHPGERLRELLHAAEILVAPGAYDAITARLAAANGFRAVYMTGAGTVNAHLGLPDIALGTLSEFTENAARIADAVDVPVFCDADTGFGNATNVIRTVRAFERAGVAGIHLEDQESPKRCGHLDGKRIVAVSEMTGKIRAACDARRDDAFVVIARVDAAAVEGLEAAIERAHAYVEAGADVIFAEAMTSEADVAAFGSAGVGAPLLANMTEFGKTPYLSAAQFEAHGFATVIFPMLAFRMMLRAVDEGFAELARTG
ncbi:MAG: isocitrate lyase/phosphoenolpyruvate mutase family protein, partial [Acidimicrobiia bacterium]|nr:isocitrate lyase/phosphoenolpyruvate mutase family protein [Acidimicrobiia bacterium]